MFGRPAGSGLVFNRRRRFVNSLRAGGIRRKLLALLFLLVVAVALLPIIVAKTPLRNLLISMVLPKDTLRVSIGDASLSWIGTPSLSNACAHLADNESTLRSGREKNLVSVLRSGHQE